MAKRFKVPQPHKPFSSRRIEETKLKEERVFFDFRCLCQKGEKFVYSNQEIQYFLKLLSRLKDVSGHREVVEFVVILIHRVIMLSRDRL